MVSLLAALSTGARKSCEKRYFEHPTRVFETATSSNHTLKVATVGYVAKPSSRPLNVGALHTSFVPCAMQPSPLPTTWALSATPSIHSSSSLVAPLKCHSIQVHWPAVSL